MCCNAWVPRESRKISTYCCSWRAPHFAGVPAAFEACFAWTRGWSRRCRMRTLHSRSPVPVSLSMTSNWRVLCALWAVRLPRDSTAASSFCPRTSCIRGVFRMDEGLVEALRVQRSRTSRTRTLLCLGSHSIKFNLAPASSFIAVTPAINSTSSDGLAAFTASFRMNLHNIPCPAPSTLHPNYRARERVVRVERRPHGLSHIQSLPLPFLPSRWSHLVCVLCPAGFALCTRSYQSLPRSK